MDGRVVQTFKPREGEVSVDLNNFLPSGHKYWFPNRVKAVKERLAHEISLTQGGIRHKCPYESSSFYSTLYIPWGGNEADLRRIVRSAVDDVMCQGDTESTA